MNTQHLVRPVAMALALVAPSAHALGLGQLQVKSGLNQPLIAEIPIVSASPAELDQLTVRLASPEAFARVGLELSTELNANLKFSISKNSQGQSVIRVSTSDKFVEPLLSFLIEADWGKGRVTREYTALIDPPYIAPAVIQTIQTPTIANAVEQVVIPETTAFEPAYESAQSSPTADQEPQIVTPMESERASAELAPATMPIDLSAESSSTSSAPLPDNIQPEQPEDIRSDSSSTFVQRAADGEIGEASEKMSQIVSENISVAPGQTLSVIAKKSLPSDSDINTEQMMLALLRANPDAFSQGNINRLKSGSVLRIPSQVETHALSVNEASALVRQQNEAWRQSRKPVPQPSESAPEVAVSPENRQNQKVVTSEKDTLKHETSKIASTTNSTVKKSVASNKSTNLPGARLEIVPPSGNARVRGAQSGAAAGAGGVELRAELVQVREELVARTSEVTELKSRVADMEKQNADRQRLLEMKDSQLHALENRLRQLEAANKATNNAINKVENSDLSESVSPASAAAPVVQADPWYLKPFVLGGSALIVLGGMVFALRRSKSASQARVSNHRLSDDEALRASFAQVRTDSAATYAVEPFENESENEHERESAIDSSFTSQTSTEDYVEDYVVEDRPDDAVMPDNDDDRLSQEAHWDRYGHEVKSESANTGSSGVTEEAGATRLKLAKAYLDIGDTEGARSMLEEVLVEGSDAMRAEAERILKEI